MGLDEIKYPDTNQAWRVWTPTITQSGTVAHTKIVARYLCTGRLVVAYCYLVITGTGTATNHIIVGGLPVNVGNSAHTIGTGTITDSGTGIYCVSVIRISATTVKFLGYNVSTYMGASPSFGLANTDSISLTIMYER